MVHISKIRARYEESDQMGFIYHSNHIVWMELARMNMFREFGIDLRDMETKGIFLPVVKVIVKYHSPAYFDDEIVVHSAISEIKDYELRIDYMIYRNVKELICYSFTELCFIQKEPRKLIRIPDQVLKNLKISESAKKWITRRLG